jgi:hypothetical protein
MKAFCLLTLAAAMLVSPALAQNCEAHTTRDGVVSSCTGDTTKTTLTCDSFGCHTTTETTLRQSESMDELACKMETPRSAEHEAACQRFLTAQHNRVCTVVPMAFGCPVPSTIAAFRLALRWGK